ncbi:hypothetical protein Tco_0983737 [Tanacetum coccineum]
MEGLHSALSDAVNSGLIRGIKIGDSDIQLSHLFYADDVVITTEWSSHDMDNIIRVLQMRGFPDDLSLGIPFPGDLLLGNGRWGTLAKDTFPSDKVGPTYFSVK